VRALCHLIERLDEPTFLAQLIEIVRASSEGALECGFSCVGIHCGLTVTYCVDWLEIQGARILNEQSKDLSMAICGAGGLTHIQETWQQLLRSGLYRLHLSGLTDYAGAYRIEAVERGVIIPITRTFVVCGSCRTPGGIIHLFLRARRCFRTTIALAPTAPRADLHC
jgi:hypothetical protein